MSKYKVSELGGDGDILDVLLDAAVQKAEGVRHGSVWVGYPEGSGPTAGAWRPWSPCTEWADGGPIIERERIGVARDDIGWSAACSSAKEPSYFVFRDGSEHATGPTPLIAAMRAYVASKFGEEVELP